MVENDLSGGVEFAYHQKTSSQFIVSTIRHSSLVLFSWETACISRWEYLLIALLNLEIVQQMLGHVGTVLSDVRRRVALMGRMAEALLHLLVHNWHSPLLWLMC